MGDVRTMNDTALESFVLLPTVLAVVETGNFARAADALGVNRAAISKRVMQIEASLGVALFERSSRKVALTPAGQVLLQRFRDASATLAAGIDEARTTMGAVRGKVVVSCGSSAAVHVVGPALYSFAAEHPGIRIDLVAAQDEPHQVEADIELRVTDAPPLDRSVRMLGAVSWQLCASADYLARYGSPQSAEDLAAHRFVVPPGQDRPVVLEHRATGRRVTVTPRCPLTSNIHEAIFELVQRGFGIGLLPSYPRGFQRTGQPLQTVLPDWLISGRAPEALYAIHAPAKFLRASTRAVLDHISALAAGTAVADPEPSARPLPMQRHRDKTLRSCP